MPCLLIIFFTSGYNLFIKYVKSRKIIYFFTLMSSCFLIQDISMGKQWKTASKLTQAHKKGALFTKLSREIQVSVRLAGANPENNSRLKLALDNARMHSLSKDTIDRAILKASGQQEGDIIEEIIYEGFGPYGVAMIISCLTDNRTRTVSEIRFLLKKNKGNLGASGSVIWMFNKVALVEAQKKQTKISIEEEAIIANADDVEPYKDSYLFYAPWDELQILQNNLIKQNWTIIKAEIAYRPKDKIILDQIQKEDIQNLKDLFMENKDCKTVYTNI